MSTVSPANPASTASPTSPTRTVSSGPEGAKGALERIVGRCVFCGADKELRTYKGRFVCAACAAALGKEDGHV